MPIFNASKLIIQPPHKEDNVDDDKDEEYESADDGDKQSVEALIVAKPPKIIKIRRKRNPLIVNLDKELSYFKALDENFKIVYKNVDKKFSSAIISCNVRVFISTTSLYEYNRPVNEEHVQAIYNGMKLEKEQNGRPHTEIDMISFFHWNDEYQIYDGQHRTEALKRLMAEFPDFNFTSVFKYVHIKNNDEREELFKKRNHTLPLLEEDMPEENELFVKICEWLKKEYKETAKGDCDEPSSVRAENFSIKEVYCQLRTFGNKARKLSFEQWKDAIVQKNGYISTHLSSIHNISKKIKWIERCKRKRCYLGLETNLKWLKDIYKEIC